RKTMIVYSTFQLRTFCRVSTSFDGPLVPLCPVEQQQQLDLHCLHHPLPCSSSFSSVLIHWCWSVLPHSGSLSSLHQRHRQQLQTPCFSLLSLSSWLSFSAQRWSYHRHR